MHWHCMCMAINTRFQIRFFFLLSLTFPLLSNGSAEVFQNPSSSPALPRPPPPPPGRTGWGRECGWTAPCPSPRSEARNSLCLPSTPSTRSRWTTSPTTRWTTSAGRYRGALSRVVVSVEFRGRVLDYEMLQMTFFFSFYFCSAGVARNVSCDCRLFT